MKSKSNGFRNTRFQNCPNLIDALFSLKPPTLHSSTSALRFHISGVIVAQQRSLQQTLGGQMSKGLIWATADDLARNRGKQDCTGKHRHVPFSCWLLKNDPYTTLKICLI
ncbi:unnamed protein product [Lactuca virosa]|uniref:Uncharacterized protein n=1 Tax=Lactuca virosa TaxID=75947 RepID=A0AAU9LRW8_9ASTR|nr:unnamed protein product [Lactuca virosa]